MRMVMRLLEIQTSKREGVEGGIIAQLNCLISSLTRFPKEFNCGMLGSHLFPI